MSESFNTLTSLHKEAYGLKYSERKPDPAKCCAEVTVKQGMWYSYSQCSRPRGFGPEQAYCKQHDPVVVAERDAKTRAAWEAKHQLDRIQWAGPAFFKALCAIADGHDDPRALAEEAIRSYREPAKGGSA
jgi:hypothetical protein